VLPWKREPIVPDLGFFTFLSALYFPVAQKFGDMLGIKSFTLGLKVMFLLTSRLNARYGFINARNLLRNYLLRAWL
jgi:hypothetical protein